jgi:ABC-type dipeptide/oligopeptide/nickel transport system permease component
MPALLHDPASNLASKPARWAMQHLGVIFAVLWGAAITFVAVKLIPGDPVSILTGGENVVDPAERALMIQQFGLDRPLVMQYARYLGHALVGNFGESYQYRRPAISVIVEAAVPTLQLAGAAIVLALSWLSPTRSRPQAREEGCEPFSPDLNSLC